MTSRSRFIALAIAGVFFSGCNSGPTSSPVAPTPAAPTIINLTITPVGGGSLIIGGSAPITSSGPMPSSGAVLGAFAEYSNGTGRYVEAAWTTSNDHVIVVNGPSLNAVGRGSATLTASFDGRSDTEDFSVEGGITGTWSGRYVVERCQAGSGSLQDVLCGGYLRPGAASPIRMELTDAGGVVSGTVAFGQVSGAFSGAARGYGLFTLRGTARGNGGSITVVQWDTQARGDAMTGSIAFEVRVDGLPSHANVIARLAGVGRR